MKRYSRFLILLGLWLGVGMAAHAGTVHYYYTDPQGTVLAETDASGHIIARYDYTPYGSIAMGTAPNGPGYTGHVNDPESGLVYMQQRYYDPSVGRFLSTDPITPAAGNLFNFNRYDYTSNNPINHTDPDGRCSDADGSCGRMVAAQGAYANAHPNEPLSPVAKVGLGAMLTASGAGPAVRLVATVRTVIGIFKGRSDSPSAPGGKTFTTYTRTKTDNTVYSGRTSGKGTPEQQVAARTSQTDHQAKTAEGYGPAKVDRNSSNPDAIRGREQQLIEQNGGARSQGGTSGNAINGVSPSNPNAARYSAACASEFGCG